MFLIPSNLANSPRVAFYDAHQRRTFSYAEVFRQAHDFRSAFESPAKSLILLFCGNNAATVFTYLSAVEAGHAVVMLDAVLAAEFKARLIEIYQPEFVVGSSPADAGVSGYSSHVPQIWRRNYACPHVIHPDLSLLLSTSGSTGTPKFVRLTRANVESNAFSIRYSLGIRSGERAITSLPLHYSYGLSVLNSHLSAGAATVLTDDGLMSALFWETFRSEACTSLAGVPYSYQILRRLDLAKLNVPTLKTLTQAGGKLDPQLTQSFHSQMEARGGRYFTMYGQTEATARIAILPHESAPAKPGSAGRAIAGGTLTVDSGEVVYRGPNVMMGYATCREDLSRGDELGGRLHTGDAGYLDNGGYLFITGRQKRDAKVFGLRLNMDEVEQMLRCYGPTAVVSRNEKLVIYCEYGDEKTFAQYGRDLASRLKLHHAALEFRRIPQLPLTPNGKVDYGKLQSRA